MAFGRLFAIREGLNLQVRAEFYNVFNRTEMGNPSASSAGATQTVNSLGVPTGGFGYINSGSNYSSPRQGQVVVRLQF
jgi:hypothetical protein